MGMNRVRSAVLLTCAAAAFGSLGAIPAGAGALPRILSGVYCSGSSCTGVYKLRPHTIVLGDAEGGNLTKLIWSSWTATRATASGTAVVSNMGTTTKTPMSVIASRVRGGLFTRMTVTFTPASGSPQVEKLKAVANPATWQRT
jgi:hypothetical protein